jgi:hypothetical protein
VGAAGGWDGAGGGSVCAISVSGGRDAAAGWLFFLPRVGEGFWGVGAVAVSTGAGSAGCAGAACGVAAGAGAAAWGCTVGVGPCCLYSMNSKPATTTSATRMPICTYFIEIHPPHFY